MTSHKFDGFLTPLCHAPIPLLLGMMPFPAIPCNCIIACFRCHPKNLGFPQAIKCPTLYRTTKV